MILSRIQESVLTAQGSSAGNYIYFAHQVETVFRGDAVKALDEFGIPWQIAKKLEKYLPNESSIDDCLKTLSDLPPGSTNLTPFEQDILQYAKAGFGI